MQRALRKILEDEDHIELFEAKLHTFQRGDLDLGQGDDEEGGVGQMDETLGGRLQADVLTDGHTLEGELAERDIDFEGVTGLRG